MDENMIIEDLKQDIINALSEETVKNVDSKKLYAIASKFLINSELLELEQKKTNSMLFSWLKGGSDEVLASFKRVKTQETALIRAQYLLAFQFDEYLNAFLGKVPKEAALVYEDKKNHRLRTERISMRSLALKIDKDLRINLSNIPKKANFEEEKGEIDINHINQSQLAYMGAIARLNRFYSLSQSSTNQGGLLMWKSQREWILARVTNKGDLKEAYVNALFSQHNSEKDYLCTINAGQSPYQSHQLIEAFFINYISMVTNKPAIVEEDVITDKFQLGVKGHRAAAPSLNQYKIVAKKIIEKPLITQKEIEDFFKSNFPDSHRNIIVETSNNIIDTVLNKELLSDFGQKYAAINIALTGF